MSSRHSDQDLNRIRLKIQSGGRVLGSLLGLEMTQEWGQVIVRLRLRVRKGLYFQGLFEAPLLYYHPVQSLNGFISPN